MTDEFRKHVDMTSGKYINGRYYFNDNYTYECNAGYKKGVDPVQCDAYGKWTAIPKCTKMGTSDSASF